MKKCSCEICQKHEFMSNEWQKASIEKANAIHLQEVQNGRSEKR